MKRPALLAALALMLGLAACSGGSGGAKYLSIATGGTGGVYYPYGGGLAKVLNENLPGVRATAEVTAASIDNLKLIRDGSADIAFVLADSLADAVGGRGAFEGRPVPVRSLAVLYSNYTHLVTAQLVPDQQVQALIEVDHRVEQSRCSQQERQANKAERYEGRAPDPSVIPASNSLANAAAVKRARSWWIGFARGALPQRGSVAVYRPRLVGHRIGA